MNIWYVLTATILPDGTVQCFHLNGVECEMHVEEE